MQKIKNIIEGGSTASLIQKLRNIRAIWDKSVTENVSKVTTPVNIEKDNLIVFVHDNIWLNELSYLKNEIRERLAENGLIIESIIYKYAPKFEKKKAVIEKEYEITENIKNYIEKSVKKIDNEKLAEAYRQMLTVFFKKVDFQVWRAK